MGSELTFRFCFRCGCRTARPRCMFRSCKTGGLSGARCGHVSSGFVLLYYILKFYTCLYICFHILCCIIVYIISLLSQIQQVLQSVVVFRGLENKAWIKIGNQGKH